MSESPKDPYPGHPETGSAPQPTGPEDPDTTPAGIGGEAGDGDPDMEQDQAYSPEDEGLKGLKGG